MFVDFTALTTFYAGRPGRGATLTPRLVVRWSGQQTSPPWRLTDQGVPVYSEKFRLHHITRRVRKYADTPDGPTLQKTKPEWR